MKFFLTIKHWQLFLILCGLYIISIPFISFFYIKAIFSSDFINFGQVFTPFCIVLGITGVLFFSWAYTLGINLHKKLPQTVNMNLTKYKLALFFAITFVLLLVGSFFLFFSKMETMELPNSFFLFMIFVFLLYLLYKFCIFYCIYFLTKALKSIELERPAKFAEFIIDFIFMWFFYAGIWILQPRINKLFRTEPPLLPEKQIEIS